MIDMLKNAKDLIAKGKALGDPELVQMGMDLLEQYSPTVEHIPEIPDVTVEIEVTEEPQYVCQNCGHTMPVDKEGRKRCPECKKHKLVLEQPALPEVQRKPSPEELLTAFEEQQVQQRAPSTRADLEQFNMQIRNRAHTRVHYDENGKPDGVIRRREQVDPSMMCNVWKDDGEEAQDPANELLKKFTKVSPRTRTPAKYIEVECENCHKTESVHPIHAGGRGRHLCTKCIQRRSQR
jgi:Zn finger protein HypA/HybF involved in hydrogenase expression